MKSFLIIILCFSVFACTTNSKNTAPNVLWHFNAKQNNPQMDHQVQPIIVGYQELLKGIANKDTSYIKATSINLVQLTDSLAALKITSDTIMQNSWMNGLGNISAELQGVIISNTEQDAKELTFSLHMTAIQLLTLLSDIGYKEHQVYIFNAANEYIEDGVYWFSFQKQSKNPFDADNKSAIQAMGVLQEMK